MYYDTVLLKDMLVRLFTSKVKWLLFSPLLIPVAFAYWAFLILTTPRYMVSTYMKTGFKARTMEEMAAIYHFDFHPGDSSSDGTADG